MNPSIPFDLSGKVAIITGASRGISLYLASPASSFTTGATFVVDGGQMVGHGIQL